MTNASSLSIPLLRQCPAPPIYRVRPLSVLFMKSWYRFEKFALPHTKEEPSYRLISNSGCECRFRRRGWRLFTQDILGRYLSIHGWGCKQREIGFLVYSKCNKRISPFQKQDLSYSLGYRRRDMKNPITCPPWRS